MSDRSVITNGLVAAVIARGDALARKGKYRRAIQVWRRLLESEGEEVELAQALIRSKIAVTYYRLSRIALRGRVTRKSWLRAIERLQLALRYDTHPEYYVELGRCYLRLGQLAKADESLAQVLQRGKPSERALYYAAVTKIRMGDYAGARELIKRGRASDPSTKGGWWERLTLLCTALEGDAPRALAIGKSPYDEVPTSVWFEDISSVARSATPSLEVAGALDAILDTLDEREVKGWVSTLGITIGDIFAHLGKYEEAVRYWTDAADGDFNQSHMEKVALTCEYQIIQAVNGRLLDDASKWYRIGIESGVVEAIRPLESAIHYYQAKEAWLRGDYRRAASGFGACLRFRATVDVARNLAISYEAYGDWLNAAAVWQTAYDLSPPARQSCALSPPVDKPWHSCTPNHMKRPKWRCSVRSKSPQMKSSLYLGCVLILLSEFDAAAGFLKKAVVESGENSNLFVALAIAVEMANRSLDERVKAWKQATRVCEEPWVVRFWRRRLLDMGDR